ncbi:hypothetical protein BJ546DRAFT_1062937 [Cryomyces antarcticus]
MRRRHVFSLRRLRIRFEHTQRSGVGDWGDVRSSPCYDTETPRLVYRARMLGAAGPCRLAPASPFSSRSRTRLARPLSDPPHRPPFPPVRLTSRSVSATSGLCAADGRAMSWRVRAMVVGKKKRTSGEGGGGGVAEDEARGRRGRKQTGAGEDGERGERETGAPSPGNEACDATHIDGGAREEYVSRFAPRGDLRSGFDTCQCPPPPFRCPHPLCHLTLCHAENRSTFPDRAAENHLGSGNIESAKTKLTMPVLAVGSEAFIGEEAKDQMDRVAQQVEYRGLTVGHQLAEESVEQLAETYLHFLQNLDRQ